MTSKNIEVKWTPFALQCLREIYDYIIFKEKSATAAQNLVNRIFNKTEQ